MVAQPGDPEEVSFAILLALALATNRIRFGLPGTERPESLSFLFCFAAITVLPPLAAFGIAVAAEADGILARTKRDRPWHVLAFRVMLLPPCVYATSWVYHALLVESWLQLPLATVVTGLTYFAVASSLSTLRVSIESRCKPWIVWNQKFFWSAPIYLLAAVGVIIALPVLHPPGMTDGLLALGLILVGYAYLKNYWTRLQHHQKQVQKIADIRHRTIAT